jgi:glycosyltransferase involved in cell wall biosynthesis
VLGTTENGIADAVGPENGVLVAQGDYKAAADAIVAILGDRDRWERMSTASRLWAEMNNLDSMCRAHEEIYKGIIRKSNKTV